MKRLKPKPKVVPQYCKACGRCIDACPQGCFTVGDHIHPASGFVPIGLDLEKCNACGLCFAACPEPYGLEQGYDGVRVAETHHDGHEPVVPAAPRETPAFTPQNVPLPSASPMIVKGTHAAAIGAILAGCRHFFGYPITPSTEGAEMMAELLPKLDGVFVQAVSEVATVNMMYGCGGAGLRCMTFTSSPGFSLMLEGISYMIGAEVPGVFVNVMRGGPGLGNIGPEQGDIKLACRGLGHGNTRALVLAPASPQEMLDLTMAAFDLAFKYRNPVIVLADGFLGQMTGKVALPSEMARPQIPGWAVYGDQQHRRNLISSIQLKESELEVHNQYLDRKYQLITDHEQRSECYRCEDAEVLLIAANTPSRMAKGAVNSLRLRGIRAGLFRPISLWPFPIDQLLPLLPQTEAIIVVEASSGQLEDELRLALSHAHIVDVPFIDAIRHSGGILPQEEEIVQVVLRDREAIIPQMD